jgi:hypothetical protein
MIYECKVYCHSISPDIEEMLGKSNDLEDGKWLPFAVDISLVDACKMSSDVPEHFTYKATSLFMQSGDTFVIDTPYKEFVKIWKQYKEDIELPSDDDLEL